MNAIGQALSLQDSTDVAAYFAAQRGGLSTLIYKLGAPALQRQQPNYIQEQLIAFAQGLCQNDIFAQMRIVARKLTPDEVQAVAAFYSIPASAPGAGGLALR
jgi:cytochrome c553